MKAVLMRTGSVPVHHHPFVSGSQKFSLSRQNSSADLSTGYRSPGNRSRTSLQAIKTPDTPIRRVSSENDVIRSECAFSKVAGSKSPPARIPEEVEDEEADGWKPLIWSGNGVLVEELGFSGDGNGRGSDNNGNNNGSGGGYGDRNNIGGYYREMLKLNPNNSLLLMNYGKYLYEVERDVERAEEYYGRAILASPGDGEALSMYGKLIWETQRDESRAKAYFDQAVYASPDDCMVLGSYAHFMWEAEDEEEGEDETAEAAAPVMVSAV